MGFPRPPADSEVVGRQNFLLADPDDPTVTMHSYLRTHPLVFSICWEKPIYRIQESTIEPQAGPSALSSKQSVSTAQDASSTNLASRNGVGSGISRWESGALVMLSMSLHKLLKVALRRNFLIRRRRKPIRKSKRIMRRAIGMRYWTVGWGGERLKRGNALQSASDFRASSSAQGRVILEAWGWVCEGHTDEICEA